MNYQSQSQRTEVSRWMALGSSMELCTLERVTAPGCSRVFVALGVSAYGVFMTLTLYVARGVAQQQPVPLCLGSESVMCDHSGGDQSMPSVQKGR